MQREDSLLDDHTPHIDLEAVIRCTRSDSGTGLAQELHEGPKDACCPDNAARSQCTY